MEKELQNMKDILGDLVQNGSKKENFQGRNEKKENGGNTAMQENIIPSLKKEELPNL